ncbi:phosphate ABC transporter permease PstA [Nocardioides sp. GY 10113]|uniref:phosphate ABC transporter permease PstA n=1 Tax=Nocardioides sp. GY 10113 TaxID=2569761 RepID=UPI0010A7F86D|nr:phosphate ABC transporter permease PstA [Nocardioides sp. GY 10113]TIC83216.1 phosphate ABC transporter permease PstA [Nocardioides sp. GY 10113]
MTTYLPLRDRDDLDAPPAVPRRAVGAPTADETFARVGAWAAALAMTWLITQRFLPLSGLAWFLVFLLGTGLIMTGLLTAMTSTLVEVRDRLSGVVVTAGALAVGAAIVSAVVFVYVRGWRPLTYWTFFTEDMAGVEPKAPLDQGGILHAMVGSVIHLGIGISIALPLGIGTAVYMTEVGGRFSRVVRTVVEAMTALPSIVAGLFIYTTVILALGLPRSGFAAGLAIAVMMLPIIARAADVVLRVVPNNLREASLALGASRWRTVWHAVLPTARPGLATAVILGVARGVGETSPVLLTSGAAPFLVVNPFDGAMNSLPLFVYTQARSGVPIAIERGFGAAAVLMVMVLTLFVAARLIARPRRARPSVLRRLGRLPVAWFHAARRMARRRTGPAPVVPPAGAARATVPPSAPAPEVRPS